MSKTKSAIGSRHAVSEPPPHGPGRPWYTTPPIAPPWPGHLAYAREYRTRLAADVVCARGKRRDRLSALLTMVNAWIKRANKLSGLRSHEALGLARADDLWVETSRLVRALNLKIRKLGGDLSDSQKRVENAIHERANAVIFRRREGLDRGPA